MRMLLWTKSALRDLERLELFLKKVNPIAAADALQALVAAAEQLSDFPYRGERLPQFKPQEIRRIFIEDYELRYRISEQTIAVVRLWHTRENR